MQRFFLVNRDYRDVDKIWFSNNVALKFHEVGQFRMPVVIDFLACHSDLFLSFWMDHVPRAHVAVFRPCDSEGSFPGENKVYILEFVSCTDNSRNYFF